MLVPLATKIQQRSPFWWCEPHTNTDPEYLVAIYREPPPTSADVTSFPWLRHGGVEIQWLAEENQFRLDRMETDTNSGVRTTPDIVTDDEEFEQACEPMFARHRMAVGGKQFEWASATYPSVSRAASERLHSKFGTYASMLRAADTEILSVDGITESALDELKYGAYSRVWEPDEDLYAVVCPDCEAEWYWPVNPFDTPIEHRWGVWTVACPICSFGPIEAQYGLEVAIGEKSSG